MPYYRHTFTVHELFEVTIGRIACVMRLLATDVARSVVCVCVFVTLMHCAKSAERIDMLFGGGEKLTHYVTYVGLRNHVLNEFEIPHRMGYFEGFPTH